MNNPQDLFPAAAAADIATVTPTTVPAQTGAPAKSAKSKPAKPPKPEDKDAAFSQFAWTKSISVSNAPMRACVFDAARAALQSGQPGSITSYALIESDELGVTGRKDDKSAKSDEEKVTFAQARYATLPQGMDAVFITFDLKVHNATTLPQSAKLDTWEKVAAAGGAIVAGQSMSIHAALTSRASEIFGLVARQVFDGEWAWRNKREATQESILVVDESGRALMDAQELGQAMNETFLRKKAGAWKVCGLFKLGTGASRIAFPSQLLKTSGADKTVAEFYRIPTPDGTGDFALRAVKIGNRLRAIDTWYARYDLLKQAIPAEPMGYAHNLRATLRKSGETVADILTRLVEARNAADKTLSDNEALYLSAITIFGGLITAEKQESGDTSNSAEA
jgi:hypothetical protein